METKLLTIRHWLSNGLRNREIAVRFPSGTRNMSSPQRPDRIWGSFRGDIAAEAWSLHGKHRDNFPFTTYFFIYLSVYIYLHMSLALQANAIQVLPWPGGGGGEFWIVFLGIWHDSLDQGSARRKASV